MVTNTETLGDAVKRIREDKKLSLEMVRKQSGRALATSYISRIENNQVDFPAISVGKLSSLAKGLGVPVTELFDLICGRPELEISPAERQIMTYIRDLPPERQEDVLGITRYFWESRVRLQLQEVSNARSVELEPRSYTVGTMKQKTR